MKKWLITFECFRNDGNGTMSSRTAIIDMPPQEWWKQGKYREVMPGDWSGCLILMVHEFTDAA